MSKQFQKTNQKQKKSIKQARNKSYQNTWIIFILTLCSFFIYYKSFSFSFVAFDDSVKVYENPLITIFSLSQIGKFFSMFVFHTYMPLTLVTYAAEYSMWQLSPQGYHVTNVLIHILNVVLLYIFLQKFSGKTKAAFIAALLFAVHPLNVETVAWVSNAAIYYILRSSYYHCTHTFYLAILIRRGTYWFHWDVFCYRCFQNLLP